GKAKHTRKTGGSGGRAARRVARRLHGGARRVGDGARGGGRRAEGEGGEVAPTSDDLRVGGESVGARSIRRAGGVVRGSGSGARWQGRCLARGDARSHGG